jgi:hypothetical protein
MSDRGVAGDGLSLLHRRIEVVDEVERCPTLHLDRLAGVMGENEDRRVVGEDMSFVTGHMSISLDGFVAGADQSGEPIGVGGLCLHEWHLGESSHEADVKMTERLLGPRGYIMGRNMFGPVHGTWGTSDWRDW